jgi:hypothetical protein
MSFVILLCAASVATGKIDEPPAPKKHVAFGVIKINGKGVEWWRWQAMKAQDKVRHLNELHRKEHAALRNLHKHFYSQPGVVDALKLAAIAYSVSYDQLECRVMHESRFVATAKNPDSTASGLGQFLDTTWDSTPFAEWSPFNFFANALAMAWMQEAGRGREWAHPDCGY